MQSLNLSDAFNKFENSGYQNFKSEGVKTTASFVSSIESEDDETTASYDLTEADKKILDFIHRSRVEQEDEKSRMVSLCLNDPLWIAAYQLDWNLVSKILELNPQANLDAVLTKGSDAGKTLLWFAASWKQWDLVNKMLELNPKANLDAAPTEGPDEGITPLWFATSWKQWALVNKMLELNPKANLDAAPTEGPTQGLTPLWFAAFSQHWGLVNKMLELNPQANLDAAPTVGYDQGKTPLWFATSWKQWALVNKMLELNPKANLDAAPTEDLYQKVAPLWLAAYYKQWDLANKMLELNPKANLDAAPTKGSNAGKKLLDLILDAHEFTAPLSKMVAYLIFIGIDAKKPSLWKNTPRQFYKWKEKKESIDLTFNRAATFFDLWDSNPENLLRTLPREMIELCCWYAICSEQPELKSLPSHILLNKLTTHVNLLREVEQSQCQIM